MFGELGETPDRVAEWLRTAGIKGVRNAARFLSPIVRFAHSKFNDVYGIDLIMGDRLRIVHADGQTSEVTVPESVVRLLERFHQGHYPELEMPSGPS